MFESHVQVPTQSNSYDCGIFLLQYVESFFLVKSFLIIKLELNYDLFFKNPPKEFKPSLNLKKWFTNDLILNKRNIIRDLILKLEIQQNLRGECFVFLETNCTIANIITMVNLLLYNFFLKII
jgi:sentrin-specific protease 7